MTLYIRKRNNQIYHRIQSITQRTIESKKLQNFVRDRFMKFRRRKLLSFIATSMIIFITLIIFILKFSVTISELENESSNINKNYPNTMNCEQDIAAIERSLKKFKSFFQGTRQDTLHSTILYNKAFVAMADLQTSTVEDANGKEHVYSRAQAKSVADQILHDNVLYIHRDQGITNAFVKAFDEEMTKEHEVNEDQEWEQLIIVYVMNTYISQFVLKCLKEQAHLLLPSNVEISQRRKFVLVTGNTDEPASYSFFVNGRDKLVNIERDLLDHPLLHHWYGQNGDIVHPKFTSLPIGIDFHSVIARSARECHQTPPEQSLEMIEPLLKEVDVKRLLPNYVHLHSVDLHPRFAPGESDDDQFDFSLVDWAIIPKKTDKSDHVQELKWTSFDKLDDAEQRMLSEMEADFGIIIEGVSRNNSRHYEQYYTTNNDSNIDANNNQEYLSSIALQRIDDQGTNISKSMNRVMLYATLSEIYMYALRTTSFGHPTLRETKVLLTFTGTNYPRIRNPIVTYLQSHMKDFAVNARVKRSKMWSMMRKYAFVASAPGGGYDCHRTWEALALGCIPIVVHPSKYVDYSYHRSFRHHRNGVAAIDVNASLELYDDLPVVIVNNFEKEVNMGSLRQWQLEIYDKNVKGEYHLYKLLNQYWFDRFLDRVERNFL